MVWTWAVVVSALMFLPAPGQGEMPTADKTSEHSYPHVAMMFFFFFEHLWAQNFDSITTGVVKLDKTNIICLNYL